MKYKKIQEPRKPFPSQKIIETFPMKIQFCYPKDSYCTSLYIFHIWTIHQKGNKCGSQTSKQMFLLKKSSQIKSNLKKHMVSFNQKALAKL